MVCGNTSIASISCRGIVGRFNRMRQILRCKNGHDPSVMRIVRYVDGREILRCSACASRAKQFRVFRSPEDRFSAYYMPEPNSGCWLWIASLNLHGYGQFCDPHTKLKNYAHRVSYEMHVGAIPTGAQLDHLCGMRCCVNPRHLQPVTPKENTRRAVIRRRGDVDACSRGHLYTPENTYTITVTVRKCRECTRRNQRQFWAAHAHERSAAID